MTHGHMKLLLKTSLLLACLVTGPVARAYDTARSVFMHPNLTNDLTNYPLLSAETDEEYTEVFYPVENGEIVDGQHPLIIILHGQHHVCWDPNDEQGQVFWNWPCNSADGQEPIPNFRGYAYLGEALAAQGYIVASINSGGIVISGHTDLGISQRAQLIEYYLDLWNMLSTTGGGANFPDEPFQSEFIGKVDMRTVGTIGHSRGGDAVVNHYVQYAATSPYRVKAVFAIAPTNFNSVSITGVPFATMLPYCDGDVYGLSGLEIYDASLYDSAADQAPKHTILSLGANHNFSNAVWTPECWDNQDGADQCWEGYLGTMPSYYTSTSAATKDDWGSRDYYQEDPQCGTTASPDTRLTPREQRDFTEAYVLAFFEYYLGRKQYYNGIDSGALLRGDLPYDNASYVAYHPPHYRRLDLDRFRDEDEFSLTTLENTDGDRGAVDAYFDNADDFSRCQDDCHQTGRYYPHGNLSRLGIGWSGTNGRFTMTLPEGTEDIGGYSMLQFRASVDYQNEEITSSPAAFSISLSDASESVTVSTDDQVGNNVLFVPPGGTTSKTSVLNTVRIPLSEFGGQNFLDNIDTMEIAFDLDEPGSVFLADFAFTTESENMPTDVVMVMDRSGSMKAQDFEEEGNTDTRLEIAKKGADYFIAALDPEDRNRVGVVSYNHAHENLADLVDPYPNGDSTVNPDLTAALDQYLSDGASSTTSIGGGVNAALTMLPEPDASPRRPAILLLTDGRQNTAPCLEIDGDTGHCEPGSEPTITPSDLENIPVCSLGMGRLEGQVDETILENFSSQYLDAQPNNEHLATAMASFTKCASIVNSMNIATDPNGILEEDMVAAPAYTYTSAGDTKLSFLSSWSATTDTDGDMRLLVTQPNGDLLVTTEPKDRSITKDWNIQRDRAPEEGTWRFQVMRDNTRIVNGFTSDAFVDHDAGVALIRRQLHRLCPEGCDSVLYYEDGRASSADSVYEDALAAEQETGLITDVDSYDAVTVDGFDAALDLIDSYDLLIYIRQLPGTDLEIYDSTLGSVLCSSDAKAIITDMRAPQLSMKTSPEIFHICSGALPGDMDEVNFNTVTNLDDTMLDGDLAIANQGYSLFSYSVSAVPQNYSTMSQGAAQLEAGNEIENAVSEGGIDRELGAIVTMSKDIEYYPPFECTTETCDVPPPQERTRSLQRWASEVHFTGFAPIEPVHVAAVLGEGVTLSVKSETFAPPAGIQSAVVWAEVVRPLVDLDVALQGAGCAGDVAPNGDVIFGSGVSISPDAIPSATASYWLNDDGLTGDAFADDRIWSVFAPELGQVQGTYEIRYYAEFSYLDANGEEKIMHREAVDTLYVGDEVLGGSTPCPAFEECDPDNTPPVVEVMPDMRLTACDINGQEIDLDVPGATDNCLATVPVEGEVIASDAGATGTTVVDGIITLPLGTHTIRWTADDGYQTSYVDQVVEVIPAIFAGQQLIIGNNAVVDSAANEGSYDTIIGIEADVSDIASTAAVSINDRAVINGTITSAGDIQLGNDVNLDNGILVPNASVVLPDLPTLEEVVFPPVTGPTYQNVNSGETLSLTPESYQNLSVNSLGILTLESGDYYFTSLHVQSDADVVVSDGGMVRIYVQDYMSMKSLFTDGFDNAVPPFIGYLGTNSLVIEAPFYGSVIAPNATMEMGTGNANVFTGEFMASTLRIRPGINLVCESFRY